MANGVGAAAGVADVVAALLGAGAGVGAGADVVAAADGATLALAWSVGGAWVTVTVAGEAVGFDEPAQEAIDKPVISAMATTPGGLRRKVLPP
ncbi:MAG TPA: hypothetical protein VIJ31_02235 [Acidothermaceae bacterium]